MDTMVRLPQAQVPAQVFSVMTSQATLEDCFKPMLGNLFIYLLIDWLIDWSIKWLLIEYNIDHHHPYPYYCYDYDYSNTN